MSSTIRIKRSGNSVSPIQLASGELAYSWAAGAGGKLYLGTGSEILPGQAPNIDVIGGKFFTDMLDHVAGTLTASSAIIVGADSKIDRLFVDNISVDGNTIKTTNTNGNLVFSTNGTGVFDFSNKRITNVADPVGSNDAVTLGYLTTTFSSELRVTGDTGFDSISLLSETLSFKGGAGISTAVTANTVTYNLTNTGVTAGSYGSTSAVPTFTVDSRGRLTSAANVNITITSTRVSDFTEAVQDVTGGMLNGSTQNGIAVSYDDNTGKLNFDVKDFTVNVTGSVAGSATVTNLANTTINVAIQNNAVTLGTHTTGNYVASLVAGTGVAITNNTGEGATPTIAIGQNVAPTANVMFNDVSLTGSITVDGNLTVSGNTFIISTQTLAVQDNIIYLNEPAYETITNVVGNGSNVVYTVLGVNTLKTGQSVTITGINPSVYNVNNATITFANTVAFAIASTATGTYVSGGTAAARVAANPDLGFVGGYDDGTYAHAGFFRDASDGRFKVFSGYVPEPSVFIDTADPSFALADIQATTFHGALSGNASTASKLLTPRTIALVGDVGGSVSFDGSANVSISTTVQPNSVVLGVDTTGNYTALVNNVAGSGVQVTGAAGEGATFTVSGIDATLTVKGVASFGGWADDANTVRQFAVTAGNVSIVSIDGGTF